MILFPVVFATERNQLPSAPCGRGRHSSWSALHEPFFSCNINSLVLTNSLLAGELYVWKQSSPLVCSLNYNRPQASWMVVDVGASTSRKKQIQTTVIWKNIFTKKMEWSLSPTHGSRKIKYPENFWWPLMKTEKKNSKNEARHVTIKQREKYHGAPHPVQNLLIEKYIFMSKQKY